MDIYQYLGHTKTSLEQLVLNIPRYYITYSILKRSGKRRRIDAPQHPLKQVQNDFLIKILYLFRAHPIAHGFVYGKSPITNAVAHVGKKYIVTVDIKDFFNSIQEGTVERCLKWLFKQQSAFTFVDTDCELLAKILCYNGGLPQGSPASPVLSNLVCLALDKKLAAWAQTESISVTRYADDITISSDDKKILNFHLVIYGLISNHGLVPNKKKTKKRRYFQRQQVTGIIVNAKLGVKKENWRNLRARLHNLVVNKQSLTVHEAQQIRGYIEWVKSLNPSRGHQLLKQFSMVSVTP